VPALRRKKNFVGEGEQICGSAIEAQGQKIAGLPQRDREVSVSLDGMSIRYGLYYSMHTRRIIGIAEDREDLNVVRRARHDTLQQQLGGQQVEDDTVDVKGAKHYLVFYATGMGAAHFQIACARYGLAAVNTKCLLEFTSRVLSALFLQGGMHAISLTYDSAKENTCASIHTSQPWESCLAAHSPAPVAMPACHCSHGRHIHVRWATAPRERLSNRELNQAHTRCRRE